MSEKRLPIEDLHKPAAVCESDADPDTNGTPARRLRDSRTGRYVLAPEEAQARAARLEALRAEVLQAVAAGRLPDTLVTLWRDELVLVADALRTLAPNPTTAAGRISREYKDYVTLVERASALARMLGLEHTIERGKSKPWAKLSREEQEHEAQRALDEVEANLRASTARGDEE